MAQAVRHTGFVAMLPVVPAGFITITLALTMFSMHPVLVAISFAGGFAYAACARGIWAALSSLRWQLPVVLVITLVNPLFVHMGSTELFVFFGRPVFMESLLYGCAMALLFLASVQWFAAASAMLSYDKVLGLLGNSIPVVALMVSMTMRLVPRFLRRGRAIASAQDVARSCAVSAGGGVENGAEARSKEHGSQGPRASRASAEAVVGASARRLPLRSGGRAARGRGLPAGVASRLRQSSVLMGWAMEDSLETADAMRARGWGACKHRTTYMPYRFTPRDAAAAAMLLMGGLLCAWVSWTLTAPYAFYPRLSPIDMWWGYLPYAAWMFTPAVLHIYEMRRFT